MWLKKLFPNPAPAAPPKQNYRAPAISPDLIAEAKKLPNGWVYAIDGVAEAGEVPPERVQGAWKVDANGEVEGEFIFNRRSHAHRREAHTTRCTGVPHSGQCSGLARRS
ncbi:MAG TPA: hypothetical protein VER17_04945 [Tepidisphaeraceae bacterium]|nr:hypothetical protein [Tepidisphaeraceae bacterium]